ncbi:MAG: site-specific DNA-methyltransferase [Bacteroidota bacterium]|nr:site-specific DNA-methyltransferase [Bacteroidota bacterium]
MTGESLSIVQDQLEKLKQLFPETITEGKIDWEKLQATLGKENIEFSNERYVLNWAGKSEAFKVLQQTTTATLKPCPGEGINDGFDSLSFGEGRGEATENVFIEGENLEVLKVLQKAYYNKIKCIIIDPPYNTGNDSFIYPDSFKESREEYQKRIGEKDEEGYLMKEGFFRRNSRDSGHYHSNWLSMMYPRLFLAKNLLRDDGVIFVHIDDNEVHNLRLLMNEIFGEENFLLNMIWHRRQNADNRNENFASTDHEYVLAYSKNALFSFKGKEIDINKYKNPDHDSRGPWASIDLSGLATKDQRPNLHYDIVDPRTGFSFPPNPARGWSKSKENILKMIENKEILFPTNPNGRPRQKKFLKDLLSTQTGFSSILKKEEVGFTTNGTQEFSELFDGRYFAFPKPVNLLKKIVLQSTNELDIILDFFGGSGTTAQAVLELNKEDGGNRKFILVQLPEPCDEGSEAFKAGYKTIADISKERIRRVINKLLIENEQLKAKKAGEIKFEDASNQENQTTQDLGFKVFKLSSSNFKIWRGSEITEENLEQELELFTDPVREGSEKENMLYELILKAGYLLTDKVALRQAQGTDSYYSVKDGELIVALEAMNQEIIDSILTPSPSGRVGVGLQKVITLDQLFTGNDQLKTNAVLQMKDAEIDFKTI